MPNPLDTLRSEYTTTLHRHEQNVETARKSIQDSTAQILMLRGALAALDAVESSQKESPDGNPTPDELQKQDS